MSVYKSEKPDYLDSSLESVIKNQTLKPNNVIIVEDGPLTTGLYDVISKWCNNPDVPITIIKNEVNMGLTKSLNRGLEYVNTDFVARMDSDDIARPNRFELQVKFFNENPNIDIISDIFILLFRCIYSLGTSLFVHFNIDVGGKY